jgi:deoxyribose-phosphate aldolase
MAILTLQDVAMSGEKEAFEDLPGAAKMTTRYTNEEWATFIIQVEKDVEVPDVDYPTPRLGSKAFAKTIDHTLLKLDAKQPQFDAVCSEARVDGFAVC